MDICQHSKIIKISTLRKDIKKIMISISKEEAQELRRLMPNIFIKRTVKQKSNRGHYYTIEEPKVIAVINKMRGN